MAHDRTKGSSLALELSCPICQCLFSEPVTLQCGHTFCEICLKRAVSSTSHEVGQHCCPECKEDFQGLETLPKNDMLRRIIESYKGAVRDASTDAELLGGCKEITCAHKDRSDLCAAETDKVQNNVTSEVASFSVGAESDSGAECSSGDGPAVAIKNDEGQIRLAQLLEDLKIKLNIVEGHSVREAERQAQVRAIHSDLQKNSSGLLQSMTDLVVAYSRTVTELIEAHIQPKEESVARRVKHISDLHTQLKDAQLQVHTLQQEQDGDAFRQGLLAVDPLISRLVKVPVEEAVSATEDLNPCMSKSCLELERHSNRLRSDLNSAQRALRNLLNPSEVTFDPDTVHPSLTITEDLKTVTFSPVKQSYSLQTKRFTSFMQALSSQSFGEALAVAGGEHCWELELVNCWWVAGVCYGEGMPRSGMASALESNANGWCLMYCDNLLRVYERTKAKQLKRSTTLRRIQICVSFTNQTITFYAVSNIDSTKVHLHASKVSLTEPVYLCVRMMSGQPKAYIRICEEQME